MVHHIWWNFMKTVVVFIMNITEVVEVHIQMENYALLNHSVFTVLKRFMPRHLCTHV